jgi:hypothetical protein
VREAGPPTIAGRISLVRSRCSENAASSSIRPGNCSGSLLIELATAKFVVMMEGLLDTGGFTAIF